MPEETTNATGQTAGEAGSSANSEATGNTGTATQNAGEKTFSQADIDRIVKDRLKDEQERSRKKAEEEEAKRKGDFEKLLSEREKELETLRTEIAAERQAALRTKIAAEFKLPAKLADRLQGDDEAALRADAAELAKLLPAENGGGAGGSIANPAGGRNGGGQHIPGRVPSWNETFKR